MQTAISKLRDFFSTGATLPTAARISSLKSLKQEILRRESDISDALAADLGKSAFESYMTEIGIAVIRSVLAHDVCSVQFIYIDLHRIILVSIILFIV